MFIGLMVEKGFERNEPCSSGVEYDVVAAGYKQRNVVHVSSASAIREVRHFQSIEIVLN